MAWRIHEYAVKGEIDNRVRGRVRGRVWLAGRAEPLVLNLSGNCLRDLAGCLLEFENPALVPGVTPTLSTRQNGRVGDMTASRKARVLDVSTEEAIELSKAGMPVPEHTGNCLYLEWFSDANGRVVLEGADYRITVSAPEWTLSEADEQEQAGANHEAMQDWFDQLGEAFPEEFDPEADQPFDEFKCEKLLRESDARADKFGALFAKYLDHPDRDKIIAHEMGWEELEESFKAGKRGAMPEPNEPEEIPPLVPNPVTERIDWVRDKSGRIQHPLTLRVFESGVELWRFCEVGGLLGNKGDPDLCEMVFRFQTTGAKLAGALNGLAYNEDCRESGFIVACLKRALNYLHQSIAAGDKVAGKNLLPADRLADFRRDQFEIREAILGLMEKYRGT